MLLVAIFSHVDLEWRKEETCQEKQTQYRERESPDSNDYLVLIVSEAEQYSGYVRYPYKLNYK